MSDEEKKAIKILKVNPEIIADLDEEMFEKMCEFKEKSIKELKYWASQTILNLIKKQQKEIEELKDIKKELTERVLRLESDMFWDNVVSKDKIKAKIEEEDKLFFKTKDVRHANRYKAYKELLEKE